VSYFVPHSSVEGFCRRELSGCIATTLLMFFQLFYARSIRFMSYLVLHSSVTLLEFVLITFADASTRLVSLSFICDL
jgi:hypothetical protein